MKSLNDRTNEIDWEGLILGKEVEEDAEENIGAQWHMAKDALRDLRRSTWCATPSPITNPIIKPLADTLVEEGCKEFGGHGDVMKKFLG